MVPNGSPEVPQMPPKVPQMSTKGAPWVPNVPQMSPKVPPVSLKGPPKVPQFASYVPQRCPIGLPMCLRCPPKVPHGFPKGSLMAPKSSLMNIPISASDYDFHGNTYDLISYWPASDVRSCIRPAGGRRKILYAPGR